MKDENESIDNKNSKQLSNEEALDIQIKYLKSPPKNILNYIIQNEPDPMGDIYIDLSQKIKILIKVLFFIFKIYIINIIVMK